MTTKPHDSCAKLTKREYFAGAALQGQCANTDMTNIDAESMAKIAVHCADVLILALNTKDEVQ